MILQNKNAVIYGAGGSIGSTVAKAFAAAGARVFLTGRNLDAVQRVADEITVSGGIAEAEKVDALDQAAINSHIQGVISKAGFVDISFNVIGLEVVQNMPLVDMNV